MPKMYLKIIWELNALSLILLLPYLSAWTVFEFEKIQWQRSLTSVTPLDTYTVFSVVSLILYIIHSFLNKLQFLEKIKTKKEVVNIEFLSMLSLYPII